ncbi:MAG: NAD(P)H-binding protein [Saprospiraceae bacterium]|nr:NAD(P)H-binding protein [Saprospiraceae bacterium]
MEETTSHLSNQLRSGKIALVIGATGATGRPLVRQLLEDSDFSEVHIFVRRKSNLEHPKLKEWVVDFNQMADWKNLIRGDVGFSCMGSTLKQAGSKEAQRKIDFDHQLNFAKLSRENGVEHFALVSAYGASSHSRIFYSKMKGELEEAVQHLGFPCCSIFQPGMLIRENTDRPMEIWGIQMLKLLNKVGLFKSQQPLPTEILAKAMIQVSKTNSPGLSKYILDEISKVAKARK